jgi:hypothetical protein
MSAPPVHLSEPLTVDVLPALSVSRRTPFRRSRAAAHGAPAGSLPAGTAVEIGVESSVDLTTAAAAEPALVALPAVTLEPDAVLLRERDEALARVAQLERQLELLNRELAVARDEPGLVWVADGDVAYHRRRRCAGLVAQPASSAGAARQLDHVTRAQALDSGKHRCQLCF